MVVAKAKTVKRSILPSLRTVSYTHLDVYKRQGGELEVIQKLGEGGQGIVYKVNYNGKQLALKWYFINKLSNPDKFYRNIQNNIKQGAPTSAFLWPLEITEYFEGSFGYLMELRPDVYKRQG